MKRQRSHLLDAVGMLYLCLALIGILGLGEVWEVGIRVFLWLVLG